jgi:hypothetical protein
MNKLTLAELNEAIEYDYNNGLFFWRERPELGTQYNARWANVPAFTTRLRSGIHKSQICGVDVLAHRAAWAIYHGEWRDDIFHYNGLKHDNRILNLRARGLRASKGYPPQFLNDLIAHGFAERLQLT